jgi:peroxiredoxin
MTLIRFVAVSGFVAVLALAFASHAATVGEEAPNFSLPTLSGDTITLDGLKGKVLLLNFWASWCTPCQEELPELQKIHQKYHERGFDVVGINIDKQQANAAKFVQRFGLTFPVLLDPESSTIQEYRGNAMPISYLLDQQGRVRHVFFGYNPAKLAGMETAIAEALNGTNH